MSDAIERAYALLDLNRPREAVAAASEAVRADPNDPAALYALASCLWIADDTDQALATAQRVCALRPSMAAAHRLRARCHIARREAWLARPAALEALRLAPDQRETWDVLARAEALAGNADEAAAAAARGVGVAPNDPESHFTQGWVALVTGREAEAEAAFQRVLAMDPQNTAAMHNLAVARGDNADSTGLLAQVVRLEPTSGLTVRVIDKRLKGAVALYAVGTWFATSVAFIVADGFRLARPACVGIAAVVPFVTTAVFVRHLRRLPPAVRRQLASRLRRAVPPRRYAVPLAVGAAALAVALVLPATRAAVWPVALVGVVLAAWAAYLFVGEEWRLPQPLDRAVVGPVTPSALAPMRLRVGAALLDLLFGTTAALVAAPPVALGAGALTHSGAAVGVAFGAVVLAVFVGGPLLLVRRRGATYGQRFARVAVVDIWTGERVDTDRHLRRMAWWVLSWFTLGAAWWPAWRGRQSLGDRRTYSAVVRRAARD